AWPSTNPASHSGYQSASASAPARAPSSTSSTSTSDCGHSSLRPYDPSAHTTTPSFAPASCSACVSAASTKDASARPKDSPRNVPSATSASRAARSERASDGVGTDLTRADAVDLLDGDDPDLAVTDLARARDLDEA